MRKISFEHQGREWTLEFDRKAFVVANKAGFTMEEILDKPVLQLEIIFRVGLQKNHPNTSDRIIGELLDEFVQQYDLQEFFNFVIEEYQSFMPTTQQSTEKKKLNIKE
jgi:hypothetical protein